MNVDETKVCGCPFLNLKLLTHHIGVYSNLRLVIEVVTAT